MKLFKYQCNENDFLITEYKSGNDYANLAKLLCHRKKGFGADGLIIYKKYPYKMLFYNQDGTEASMCGNGIRALGMHLYKSYQLEKSFEIVADKMIVKIDILDGDNMSLNVRACLGLATPYLKDIPINEITISSNKRIKLYQTKVGTPHTIGIVDKITDESIDWLQSQALSIGLANKTNLSLISRATNRSYYIKTYEKGVGFTSSCATAAASAYAILKHLGVKESKIEMISDGGYLDVMGDDNIFVEGMCKYVGECSYVVDNK